jgi:tetratricopeptide (TPR) repeat protein
MGYIKRLSMVVSVIVVILTAYLVYKPGLYGDFVFDDANSIALNEQIRIKNLSSDQLVQAALSSHSGPLKRSVSMVSFALNYYATGINPYYFKLTNLLVHVLNGMSLFLLSALLLSAFQKNYDVKISPTQRWWISLIVAAAWLLHPLALTSVLYVVQRMNSLAALFTIWGLIGYVWARLRLNDGKRGVLLLFLSFSCFGLLASFSKENGLLLPLYLLVIEFTLFGFRTSTAHLRYFLVVFFMLVVALPIVAIGIYGFIHPEFFLGGYHLRDFSLTERLLTEARALWFYIKLILLPNNSQLGLFHDDIAVSAGLLQPITTLFALLALLGVAIFGVAIRKRLPILSFGILFFLTGHAMESTIFPLELVHEHRNYLPMYGILFALLYGLMTAEKFISSLPIRGALATMFIGLLAFSTGVRATYWGNSVELAEMEVRHHPDSARSNYEAGRIYSGLMLKQTDQLRKMEYYLSAFQFFTHAVELKKSFTPALFGLVIASYDAGGKPDVRIMRDLKRQLRDAPFDGKNVDFINALEMCEKDGVCTIADQDMIDIFDSALHNPTVLGNTRAAVLTRASEFFFYKKKDYEKALEMSYEAVKVAPGEGQYYINLAHILISLGKPDSAQHQLSVAKNLDKYQINATKIWEVEQRLRVIGSAAENSVRNTR